MTNIESENKIFTNKNSVGDGEIESGSITEQLSNGRSKALPIENFLTEMGDEKNNDRHDEEIDIWVDSLERILQNVPRYMCSRGHPGRISRIPESLREVDMKGYEPYFLSIGPYHHGKTRVQSMEARKKLALKCVLDSKPELTIRDFLNEIMSSEPITRSFYSDIQMESEKFVQMLLLDSVYIIAAFCRLDNEDAKSGETLIIEEEGTEDDNRNLEMMASTDACNDINSNGESWYWGRFAHDLFLIENQIPFFLLQKIHNLVCGDSGTKFIDIMKYEVANMLTDYTKQDIKTLILPAEEVHHLMHLCHMFFRPTIQHEFTGCLFSESSQMFRLGSAVQLYEAGVSFAARSRSGNYSLLDITFDGSGKMVMPSLHVDDNTESLLRNLIALEQMKYPSLGLDISAYIVLLLHLITVPRDVELLRRKGIIQHHLASDKEMVYLVNRLSLGLAFDYIEDNYSLKQVFHELKCYSERRGPRWRAWLKHRHFSNPWTAISFLVASLLLILTVVQTYYAVYSYYYPCFNCH